MKIRKKERYFFNPESLQFESVGKSITRTVRRVLSFLIFSFVTAAAIYFLYSMFFDTPIEYARKRENKILEEHLEKVSKKHEDLALVISDISVRDTNIYLALFETKPPMIGGVTDYAKLSKKNNPELIQETKKLLNDLDEELDVKDILIDSLDVLIKKNQDKLKYIPGIQPIENKKLNAAGASIGEKINPIHKSIRIHTGMDFAAPEGTNVMATADGVVEEVWYTKYTSGNRIKINHGNNGYETNYLYLNEILVKRGDKVTRGQVIGKVGNLGMTVSHLHYEVRHNGKIADPLNYFFMELNPSELKQLIAISLNNGQSLD